MTIGYAYAVAAHEVLAEVPFLSQAVLGRRLATLDEDLPLASITCRRADGKSTGAAADFEFETAFLLMVGVSFFEQEEGRADKGAEELSEGVLQALMSAPSFIDRIEDVSSFSSQLTQPDMQGQPRLWVLSISMTLEARSTFGLTEDDPLTSISGRNDPEDPESAGSFGVDLDPEDGHRDGNFQFILEREK